MNLETTQNSVTENNGDTQMSNLQEPVMQWADLTHDTDVNFLPGASRPTREESLYIEVYHNDGYVPMNAIIESNKVKNNKVYNDNEFKFNNKFDNNKGKSVNIIRDTRDVSNLITPENSDADNLNLTANKNIAYENRDSVSITNVRNVPIQIEGLKVEFSDKAPELSNEGVPSVLADAKVTLRLFGQGMTERTVIALSYDEMSAGDDCKFLERGEFLVSA